MNNVKLVAISRFLDGFGLDMDAEYRERVERAADGYADNDELFTLLQDKRVQWVLEQRLNTAFPKSRLAERADSFMLYLRERLNVDESVPDSWVVKSFGFNLWTGDRTVFGRFLAEGK